MISGLSAVDRRAEIAAPRARVDAAASSSATAMERAAPTASPAPVPLSPNAAEIKRSNDLAAAIRAAAVALVAQPVEAARPEKTKTVAELAGIAKPDALRSRRAGSGGDPQATDDRFAGEPDDAG